MVILALWVTTGLFLTFADEYRIDNVFSRLGFYGRPIPGRRASLAEAGRYPPERVAHANHLAEVIGNWVLFVPLAIALVLVWPRVRAWQVGLCAAVLSTMVEVGQGVTGYRSPQVTDVLVNTAGAVAAYLVIAAGRAVARALRPRRPGRGADGLESPVPAAGA